MPSLRALTIEYVPPSELKPDKGNPRSHPKKQVNQLITSIEAFRFINPILVDEDLHVIAGHGRLLAAKRLGLNLVPIVRIAGLTPSQKMGLRIADNKIAQNASWDVDLLREHIVEIQRCEPELDLSFSGFSIAEIDLILHPNSESHIEEPTPEKAQNARTQLGDIWQLGPHRVGCGDARDLAFVQEVVGDGCQVDAAFLDPPYNVPIKGHANVKSRHRDFAMAIGEMGDVEFTTFLRKTLGVGAGVSKEGAVHFVCMDWRHASHLIAAGDVYGAHLNLCVWNKSNAGMGSLYRSKHELIFVYRVGSVQHYNAVELGRHGRNRTNVWDYPSVNTQGVRAADLDWHPTVKPVAMVADAIRDVTRLGEIVLDTFLGAGTTLIAAERTERYCRGVELNPGYVDIAIERWEAMTGQEAIKLPSLLGRPSQLLLGVSQ